ncbi:hypothetical protein ONZ45_g19231 [Pleurotus djamor]|nr:hypothetical protein ONZ45_g19231 [Pleurotus djamor]
MLLPSAGLVTGAPSETPETKALGLVDELDDPSPGHLSDRPKALTSVTTIASTSSAKPLFSTLEDRFVKQTDANQSNEQSSRGK